MVMPSLSNGVEWALTAWHGEVIVFLPSHLTATSNVAQESNLTFFFSKTRYTASNTAQCEQLEPCKGVFFMKDLVELQHN